MDGEIISYKLNGEEKLHQGSSVVDENGKVYWDRHSPVLFPIVGKLKQNRTIINGKTYEIFRHGFARDLEFEPITKLNDFHSYVLKSNDSTKVRFPYDFSLYTTYRTDENRLTTIYKVVNEGDDNMPFGIGGHPAFKVDLEDLLRGEYFLEFEEEENKIHFLYLVDGLIGTEYARNIMINKKQIPITKDTFNNDAVIMKGITSNKVSLLKKTGNKKILTMDFTGFPYLAIWSKKGAPFVCIEPWQNHTDSINTNGEFSKKEDILKIKSNEKFECSYKVKFYIG